MSAEARNRSRATFPFRLHCFTRMHKKPAHDPPISLGVLGVRGQRKESVVSSLAAAEIEIISKRLVAGFVGWFI
jgi:hypothetical protein